jgi:hypothetical protein
VRWLRDYVTTPDADPVYLYTNDLVGIVPERHINNGQPSLHAQLIHQAAPAAGEHVVHVSERALAKAFANKGWQNVRRLYHHQKIPARRCWLRGAGWCLAYD